MFSRVYLAAIKDRNFMKKYEKILSPGQELVLKFDINIDSEIEEVIKVLHNCDSPHIVKHLFSEEFFVTEKSFTEAYGEFSKLETLLEYRMRNNSGSCLVRATGMEYLEGPDLQTISEKRKKNLFKYILQIASGLNWLHAHDIMHLQVKPSNIMLHQKGEIVI